MLNELTILVPSFNRQSFILRLLNFWNGKEANIKVFDGSKNSISPNKLSKFSSNIEYFHMPDKSMYERFFIATKYVKTEYVMYGSDDEFYLPSALNECINFLKSNHDYVTCAGRAIAFSLTKGRVLGRHIYPKLKGKHLNSDDAGLRVKEHFSNYAQSHLYAVSKFSSWQPIAQMVFSKEYSFYASCELQIEFLLPFFGKTKVLQELMWIRSFEISPIRGTSPSNTKSLRIEHWWDHKEDEKKDFFENMEIICTSSIKESRNIKHDIIVAFEEYMNQSKNKNSKASYLLNNGILLKLKNKFINIIKNNSWYPFSLQHSLIKSAKLLEDTDVKVSWNELFEIEELVRLYYRNQNN